MRRPSQHVTPDGSHPTEFPGLRLLTEACFQLGKHCLFWSKTGRPMLKTSGAEWTREDNVIVFTPVAWERADGPMYEMWEN